jgi:NMD protein affecting ribosome stability and mRNA decay
MESKKSAIPAERTGISAIPAERTGTSALPAESTVEYHINRNYCPECGKKYSSESIAFCPHCGHPRKVKKTW